MFSDNYQPIIDYDDIKSAVYEGTLQALKQHDTDKLNKEKLLEINSLEEEIARVDKIHKDREAIDHVKSMNNFVEIEMERAKRDYPKWTIPV